MEKSFKTIQIKSVLNECHKNTFSKYFIEMSMNILYTVLKDH